MITFISISVDIHNISKKKTIIVIKYEIISVLCLYLNVWYGLIEDDSLEKKSWREIIKLYSVKFRVRLLEYR